tara:strand:+ start:825 stop:935 length:111 start_codon:yes stop_codon:yes gene_type:complete
LKSSSAWYEDLVMGEEETNKKPLDFALNSSSLNSSG